MAVPGNYDQIRALRNAKDPRFKPCPYVKESVKVRNYQTIGIGNFILLKRLLLGDGAGLGKTLQVLAAYAKLKERDPDLKMLVVTLKSTARQWAKEVDKFLNNISCGVVELKYRPEGSKKMLTGAEARRQQYIDYADLDIIVVSWPQVGNEYDIIRDARSNHKYMVVFDECQEFKNNKSKTFHGAYHIADKADRVYGLSATPIKNRLVEFYNIFSIIAPGILGKKKSDFEKRFLERTLDLVKVKGVDKYMWKTIGYKNLREFVQIIEPYFLSRKTDDVSDELPKIVARKIELEMDLTQQRLYNDAKSGRIYEQRLKEKYYQVLDEMRGTDDPSDKLVDTFNKLQERYDALMTKDGKKVAKTASLMYCQMAANGPRWLGESDEGVKEEYFRQMISEEVPDAKIIVYTSLESGITHLSDIVTKCGRKFVRITGSEDSAARDRAQELFQDPNSGYDIIFITKAGSAGVNLQTAEHLVFYDAPWSFGDLYQIIGRAQRLGSLHAEVIVTYLSVIGSIDEHVLDILDEKRDLVDKVMGDIAKGALAFKDADKVILGDGSGEEFIDVLYARLFG